jgi:N-acetylglucosamine kinase-like BadF-type ATPase
VLVETDAFIAYMGAIGIQPGVLLIAGTGSIVIARNAAGQMCRTGGWGPVFGDEGGGFWIGREAVRTALRAEDSRTFPGFVSTITTALGRHSIRDAVTGWATGDLDVRSIAALASCVIPQFPAEPAGRIVREAAAQLRSLVEDGRHQAGLDSTCRIAAAGSIAAHPVIQKLIALTFHPPAAPPERGAILWARARIQAS